MKRSFRLGFLTHVSADSTPQQTYDGLTRLFVAAEKLGFQSGWIAQHHLSRGTGLSPSPLVLLSAIAAHTKRIHLATGVTVLPFEHPLRLAEDASVLNVLSNGRVQLGLGSGGANIAAFPAFDVEYANRAALFQRGQESLQTCLEGTGRYKGLEPVGAGLGDRLWHSHSTTEGAVYAAEQANGLLLGTAVHNPASVQKPLAEAYLDAWTHAAPPRLGIIRAVFPAVSKQDAQDVLAPDLAPFGDWLRRENIAQGELTTADIIRLLNVHHGSPDDIEESLRNDPALFQYLSDFVVVVQSASSTIDDAIGRLEIIAREIAPRFGWQPDAA